MIRLMAINLNQLQRLAFIRFLHQVGVDQARKPDPFSSAAILSLHDAVESFLLLAAEHFGVTSREFEKYWKEFEPHLPVGVSLPEKASMARLNRTRVALKHHGSQPNKHTVDQAVSDVATFFSASTQLVFGVDYGSISMADLISAELPRQLAEEAETAAAAGDLLTGMMRLVEVFDCLFADHRPTHTYLRASPFAFGPNLDGPPGSALGQLGIEDQIQPLKKAVQSMQIAMRLAALSIDYAAYVRFDLLTPKARRTHGSPTVYWSAPRGFAPDQEAFDFCMQFLVTASLRLDAAEAQATDPAWVTRDHQGRIEMEFLREELAIENRPKSPEEDSGEPKPAGT